MAEDLKRVNELPWTWGSEAEMRLLRADISKEMSFLASPSCARLIKARGFVALLCLGVAAAPLTVSTMSCWHRVTLFAGYDLLACFRPTACSGQRSFRLAAGPLQGEDQEVNAC